MELRQIVERRCDSKRYFKKLTKAEKIAAKLSNRGGGLTIAYKCLDCDGYHVGHADQSQILAHSKIKLTAKETRQKLLAEGKSGIENACPKCKAEPGQPCASTINRIGCTLQETMRVTHKERKNV